MDPDVGFDSAWQLLKCVKPCIYIVLVGGTPATLRASVLQDKKC